MHVVGRNASPKALLARLAETFIEQIRFFTKFVFNCDESLI